MQSGYKQRDNRESMSYSANWLNNTICLESHLIHNKKTTTYHLPITLYLKTNYNKSTLSRIIVCPNMKL